VVSGEEVGRGQGEGVVVGRAGLPVVGVVIAPEAVVVVLRPGVV